MGSAASTPTFEIRDGKEWVTFTTATGDTTSDQVSRLKGDPDQGVEARPEWTAVAARAYDAWKADKKAQAEAKKADEAKAEATPAPAVAPEDSDDDDDDKNDKAGTRRTLAKGYRK